MYLRYYTRICLEGLMETMEVFSGDNLCPGWNLNWESSKHKLAVFLIEPNWSKSQFVLSLPTLHYTCNTTCSYIDILASRILQIQDWKRRLILEMVEHSVHRTWRLTWSHYMHVIQQYVRKNILTNRPGNILYDRLNLDY